MLLSREPPGDVSGERGVRVTWAGVAGVPVQVREESRRENIIMSALCGRRKGCGNAGREMRTQDRDTDFD